MIHSSQRYHSIVIRAHHPTLDTHERTVAKVNEILTATTSKVSLEDSTIYTFNDGRIKYVTQLTAHVEFCWTDRQTD